MTVYRGAVLQTHQDVNLLEEVMPMWLIKYLLFNEIPIPTPLVKLSFVLLPWNKDPECEALPELLNTYVDFHLFNLVFMSFSEPNPGSLQIEIFVSPSSFNMYGVRSSFCAALKFLCAPGPRQT